jgi:hypothetical protein
VHSFVAEITSSLLTAFSCQSWNVRGQHFQVN